MSRHLEPIPESDQAVLLSLADAARDLATRNAPSELVEEFRLVEAEHRVRGCNRSPRTAPAGDRAR
jgi:hypothetical protein